MPQSKEGVNMKKIVGLITLLIICISVLVLVWYNNSNYAVENRGYKNIEIVVIDGANTTIFHEAITTEAVTLLEAMQVIDELQLETEDSQFGAFITSIAGVSQEYYFWIYYVNGDYALVGVSSHFLRDGDEFRFVLERFE
ncbi:MAG: DUF4430 domain-containing protein [Pseudomonadales bacterium]|jgi:hypothetical protein|nr:DUF4430 domain-containing protein [Pseudomonadales bacterium]